jgi:ADP-ribosyl-[dinitrogen reductase] hydrolase
LVDIKEGWVQMLARAQGFLLGQLAGDALGSLVEFRSAKEIAERYPDGIRHLADGGTWNTIAGQPTDDSEMALLLARMLVREGTYIQDEARAAYEFWLASKPFDCGMTVYNGIRYEPNHDSQANGALMRISALGIFGARYSRTQVAEWARKDAIITHPNKICRDVNALYAMAIAEAVRNPVSAPELYALIDGWALDLSVEAPIRTVIQQAVDAPPANYEFQQGWVLIAFQNAICQLLHAPTLEAGVIDTVMRGGDTDTNAAICGALLGAVNGVSAIPRQWRDTILSCRPEEGREGVHRPRPEVFWPVDAMELAEALISGRSAATSN